jgi:putative ABC transport system permease protein
MALRAIWAQKLKSFFSLIGVLIGVTFLIAVVSIVQGMNVYMEEQFADKLVGINTFQLRQRPNIVMENITEETWRAWARRPRISYDDARFVRERMSTPVTTSFYCADNMTLSY